MEAVCEHLHCVVLNESVSSSFFFVCFVSTPSTCCYRLVKVQRNHLASSSWKNHSRFECSCGCVRTWTNFFFWFFTFYFIFRLNISTRLELRKLWWSDLIVGGESGAVYNCISTGIRLNSLVVGCVTELSPSFINRRGWCCAIQSRATDKKNEKNQSQREQQSRVSLL